MKKKQCENDQEQDSDLAASVTSRPARNSGGARKVATHSSSKRKQAKTAKRKGTTTGGIHQRGDKRVIR